MRRYYLRGFGAFEKLRKVDEFFGLRVRVRFRQFISEMGIRLFELASFSPDRLHNRPEAARYLLTFVTACSYRDTHALSKFS
jgi:hypothetical protein